MTKPTFVMLVGLPASGKTTYAKTLKENDGYEHFSSDELRLSLGFGPGEGSGAVFQKMLEGSKAALQEGKSVIYDATNLSRKRRIHCLETLKSIICTKKCIIFAEPYELCLERNSKRDNFARVPNARMKDMLMTL